MSFPSSWRITRDLDVFLDRAGPFLRSEPATHTVQLSVTDAVRTRGAQAYGEEAPYFAWFTDPEGAVRATALRTPPYHLQLTDTTPEAADALAGRLAEAGETGGTLPGVGGPVEATADFAAAWERRTGAVGRLLARQRLYRLGTLVVPEPAPPGKARIATAEDLGVVARWYDEFLTETGEHGRQDPEKWAGARIAYGGITLWELPDGTPVAMAGVTPLIAGQVRVTTVYTPPALRGRGYAGAATAEVSRAAAATGADEVLLFTDLANPTSNGLYQRIGYRPVQDFAARAFTPPAAGPLTATAAP